MKQFVLALGSGGIRGFGHIGVLKALDNYQLRPNCIYGTSAGSLVGAFYQSGFQATEIEKLAISLQPIDLIDLCWPKNGFLRGLKLNHFINKNISVSRIEKLPHKFRAIASDCQSGKIKVISEGVLSDAIQASCSIPGVFRPAVFNHQNYLDGDLNSPVPMMPARQEFPEAIVMGVNIIPALNLLDTGSVFWSRRVAKNTYRHSLIDWEKPSADIYLDLKLPPLNWSLKKWAQNQIDAGYQQTLDIIPKLKQILESV